MERLTKRTPDGHAYLVNVKPDEQEVDCASRNTAQCIMDSWERLAAYEDTGLTPAEINGMVFDNALDIKFGVTIDRLRELAEADKDGRCVVLPCKVGDTIYKVCQPCGEPFGIYQEEVGGFAFDGVETMVCPGWSIDCVRSFANADDFGKTAFLTPADAAAALEARK